MWFCGYSSSELGQLNLPGSVCEDIYDMMRDGGWLRVTEMYEGGDPDKGRFEILC